MDAIASEPDGAKSLRPAQPWFEKAARFATDTGDPALPHLEALRDLLASITRLEITLKETRRPELEPGVIRKIQESLENLGTETGDAVAKEIEPKLVASVTGNLKQQLALLAHVTAWRVVAITSVIPVLALIIGAGVGYWQGHLAGYGEAATTIEASGPVEKVVLARQGLTGLHRWHQLMRDNDILATMKQDCRGKSVQHQDGRTACNLWLWTTPNVVPTPKG